MRYEKTGQIRSAFRPAVRSVLIKILAVIAVLASVASVSACGSTQSGHVIRIGIKFDQPGVGYKKNGTYSGFDVDVARYIAHKLGYKDYEIEWTEAPSKQRETMLQNGDVDMILASYSITDDRKKTVSFAGPYLVAGQDLLIRKSNTSIKGPDDLNGKRLCSVTGSTSATVVKQKYSNKVQLMEQPSYAECATALFSGIVDAVTTDDIILAGLASNSRGKLKLVGHPFTQEYYGVGIQKNKKTKAFAKKINAAIKDMIKTGAWKRAIWNNTSGTGFSPDTKYNPPKPTEGEK
ncbi:glutamate-binding protein GluB [Scardovia inopinata]|uniref:Solute-binding protein family 3/N-terminal domain-containing protein n=1 Tax=Scardovia inopinata F0304 TaxID=641146 RepID=W5IK38_SCAIO|nr:glutamate ABC transporter substrate-binding protein [Scardovia inopinata]EFG27287.1 hypothetical protein HMPREF9020_00928 [Scardovia inopinata F0304]BAR06899.1 glutamate ABC transporter substrate binding component [Scardovia inopinata JCM 12537]SUV50964.1 glutamate-binding protein GluB [Scardovia inopinata]